MSNRLPSGVQDISYGSAKAQGLLDKVMNKYRPVYTFTLFGSDKNKNPVFKWFNVADQTWTTGDIDGGTLPKRAIAFVDDTAKDYQKNYADVTGQSPWGKFHTTNQKNLDEWYEEHDKGLLNRVNGTWRKEDKDKLKTIGKKINPIVQGMYGVHKVQEDVPEPPPPESPTKGMTFKNRREFINYYLNKGQQNK